MPYRAVVSRIIPAKRGGFFPVCFVRSLQHRIWPIRSRVDESRQAPGFLSKQHDCQVAELVPCRSELLRAPVRPTKQTTEDKRLMRPRACSPCCRPQVLPDEEALISQSPHVPFMRCDCLHIEKQAIVVRNNSGNPERNKVGFNTRSPRLPVGHLLETLFRKILDRFPRSGVAVDGLDPLEDSGSVVSMPGADPDLLDRDPAEQGGGGGSAQNLMPGERRLSRFHQPEARGKVLKR